MAAKIIIKRRVSEDKAHEMEQYIDLLRQAAMTHPGYFYGDTDVRDDRSSREYVVTSTWQSYSHWERWMTSSLRGAIQCRIDQLADSNTEYQLCRN